MALSIFTACGFPGLSDSFARSAHGVCIYYVHIERNAWHSTWIGRYRPDCMHASRSDAEEFAESLRRPGTVVYIQELPALAIRTERGCLVVTQINCDSPLKYYSPFINLSGRDEPKAGFHWLRRENNKLIGEIVDSLRPTGIWWAKKPPDVNAVIILGGNEPFQLFDPLPDSPSCVRGNSNGEGRRLFWSPVKNYLDPEPIRYLDRMFLGDGHVVREEV